MDQLSIPQNEDGTYGDSTSRVLLYRHAISKANMIYAKKDLTQYEAMLLDW